MNLLFERSNQCNCIKIDSNAILSLHSKQAALNPSSDKHQNPKVQKQIGCDPNDDSLSKEKVTPSNDVIDLSKIVKASQSPSGGKKDQIRQTVNVQQLLSTRGNNIRLHSPITGNKRENRKRRFEQNGSVHGKMPKPNYQQQVNASDCVELADPLNCKVKKSSNESDGDKNIPEASESLNKIINLSAMACGGGSSLTPTTSINSKCLNERLQRFSMKSQSVQNTIRTSTIAERKKQRVKRFGDQLVDDVIVLNTSNVRQSSRKRDHNTGQNLKELRKRRFQ